MELLKELHRFGEVWHIEGKTHLPHFKAINIGPYTLSIQGSEGHYCFPRKDLIHAHEYSSMEVMMYINGSTENVWASDVYRGFLLKYPQYNDTGFSVVEEWASQPMGWVPLEMINLLYLYLKDYVKA